MYSASDQPETSPSLNPLESCLGLMLHRAGMHYADPSHLGLRKRAQTLQLPSLTIQLLYKSH